MKFSRRGLFAFLGAAALAPKSLVAPGDGVALTTIAHPVTNYTHTAYGLGYHITRSEVSALWPGLRDYWRKNYDATAYENIFNGAHNGKAQRSHA